jgi:Tfp pilus assembly protein PilO
MRAVREQPRLVIARVLAALCLVLGGAAVGNARDDGRDEARATQTRLVSAQRSAREQRAEVQRLRAELDRVVAARRRAVHALHGQRRLNQRLRLVLRLTRRAQQRNRQP